MTRRRSDSIGQKMSFIGSDGKSNIAVEFHITRSKGVFFHVTSTGEEGEMITVELKADDMRNLREVMNNCLRCEAELSGAEVITSGLHRRYR